MQVSLSPAVNNYNNIQAHPMFKANVLESVINNNGRMQLDTFKDKPAEVKEKTLTEKEKTERRGEKFSSKNFNAFFSRRKKSNFERSAAF